MCRKKAMKKPHQTHTVEEAAEEDYQDMHLMHLMHLIGQVNDCRRIQTALTIGIGGRKYTLQGNPSAAR